VILGKEIVFQYREIIRMRVSTYVLTRILNCNLLKIDL